MDDMSIWSRFTKTGSVEDYLVYKKSLQSKKIPVEDTDYEDEYQWLDTQRTEYR